MDEGWKDEVWLYWNLIRTRYPPEDTFKWEM